MPGCSDEADGVMRNFASKRTNMHVLHTFANNSAVPYLSWFAERAAQEGNVRYTFLVMYPERPAMLDEMRVLGFRCEWIRYDDRKRKWGMIKALPQLWWYMMSNRQDVVHCNLFDDTLPGLLAAWAAGIKVRITTRQDTGYHWVYAPRWVFLDRWNTRLSSRVIAISGECRRFLLEQEKAPKHKVALVHNGIPPERFTRQRPEAKARLASRFRTEGRSPVVGTVARFIPWKGYRHIVDAAARLVERHPDALFLLCGEGEQQEAVRAWVREAALERNVVLTGWIDRQDMASFYGLLDIYLHAAELEPFGLVYAEAMMNGVPVVSTPTGAALDVIESGTNGILVPRATGVALSEGMELLLRSGPAAIGEAGRITALERFPFEVMWKGTMDVYGNALAP